MPEPKKKQLTNEELQAQIANLQASQDASEKRERLVRTNTASLGGYVTELEPLPQSAKSDKDGKAILGDDGQPVYFDPMFKCVVAGMGVDESLYFGLELAHGLEIGHPYIFEGNIKDRKFKVKSVTKI